MNVNNVIVTTLKIDSARSCMASSFSEGIGMAISSLEQEITVRMVNMEENVAKTVKSSGEYIRVSNGNASMEINCEKAVPPTNILTLRKFRFFSNVCSRFVILIFK